MMRLRFNLSSHGKIIIVSAVLILALLVIFTLQKLHSISPPVAAKPDGPVPTFMLPDNYVFRQDDARWESETIGPTEDSLRAYGCTIATVAMSTSNLTQTEITPQTMQTRLSEADGFTDRGWLVWAKVRAATDNQVVAKYYDTPRHEDINSCMAAGNYPVIKIKLHGSVIHWVMIVGTSEDDYLIRDPLVGESSDNPIALSSRSDDIYGVRCIMKVAS